MVKMIKFMLYTYFTIIKNTGWKIAQHVRGDRCYREKENKQNRIENQSPLGVLPVGP